ncbi:MAG: radical SAM protein [Elusimicrobiota bacterium]|nr:radical SAM protein [Elusimicrobiota bacterium]
MKITFIRPNMAGSKASDSMPPLSIAVLDALTPPGIETEFYDDRIERVPQGLKTDLAAITVETFTARRAYAIAAELRRRGVHVVMGGYHPTFLPEEALEHADTVIVGEAEGVWERMLEDFRAGKCRKIYEGGCLAPLAGAKYARKLFRGKKYVRVAPVQWSRGCGFACDFCSISAFYGATQRRRPAEEVVAEIGSLGKKYFFLIDDNFARDREEAKKFLTALAPLNIRWSTQVSIDIAGDAELLWLMQKSGCMAVLIGFESLDKRNLEQMGKGVNLRGAGYAAAVRRIKDHGIMVYGTFVFGYDFDTKDSFGATLDFALENKLVLANFNPLMPMPGTPLYARLEAEGRLIYKRWWLDPGFRYGDAMFRPRGMTAGELTEGCWKCRTEFNRYSSIAARALDLRANCASPGNLFIFLLSNLVSRKEIFRKQGAALGGAE